MLRDGTKKNPKYLMNSINSYEEGDYVILPGKRPKGWVKDMDKFLNKLVKIDKIHPDKSFGFYRDGGWNFYLHELQTLTNYNYARIAKITRTSKLLLI